jgi:hypothetical protein
MSVGLAIKEPKEEEAFEAKKSRKSWGTWEGKSRIEESGSFSFGMLHLNLARRKGVSVALSGFK